MALWLLLCGCVDDKPQSDNVVAVFDGGVLTREDLVLQSVHPSPLVCPPWFFG